METLEAIVLGVVQGLTEFLPVSSSGHLVLFQNLLGLHEPEILFDICVHIGTLVAVLVVFHKDIWRLLTAACSLPRLVRETGSFKQVAADNPEIREIVFIVVGSVPTALLGIMFAEIAHRLFSSVTLVGIMLLVTGTFLWFTRKINTMGRPLTGMRYRDALLLGLAQGIAILPGISRSGATISAALYLGIDREIAGRFSFLLSIPAILGALILGLDSEAMQTRLPFHLVLIGAGSAAVVGYAALKILLRMVRHGHLHRFAPYCWMVGGAALIVSIL